MRLLCVGPRLRRPGGLGIILGKDARLGQPEGNAIGYAYEARYKIESARGA